MHTDDIITVYLDLLRYLWSNITIFIKILQVENVEDAQGPTHMFTLPMDKVSG